MSTITDEGRKIALKKYGVRLLPSSGDRSHLIAASAAFGPFEEGEYLCVALNTDSYITTGTASVTATSSDVLLPAGVHDFVMPSGVTHVAVYSDETDAAAGVWKS